MFDLARFLREKPTTTLQNVKDCTIFLGSLCVGMFVLEALLLVLLRPLLVKVFRTNKALSEQQAQEAVGQAVTRILGGIHHAVQIPVAIIVLTTPSLSANAIFGSNQLSSLMIGFAAAFFTHDFITCIRMKEPATYKLHATVCMSVFSYAFFSRCMHYYGAAFLMWELSTIFVYLRWLLWKTGHSDSPIYVANGLALITAFFLCRNVFGIYTSIRFWIDLGKASGEQFSPFTVWVYRLANWTLNGLNYFWFYKMVTQASKVIFGGKKASVVGSDKDE